MARYFGLKRIINHYPIYLFLFPLEICLLPILSNLGQISFIDVIRPLLILAFSNVMLCAILWTINKNVYRAGYLSFIFFAFMFFFGYLISLINSILNFETTIISTLYIFTCWVCLFFFLASAAFWKKITKNITKSLNLIMVVLLIPAFGQTIFYLARNIHFDFPKQPLDDVLVAKPADQYPDIYLIVLDSYGQQEVLADIYGVNNKDFLSFLSKNGFYIAKDSRSNYTKTHLSMMSILNFEYLDAWNPPENPSNNRDYIVGLLNNNYLFPLLKSYGYEITALGSGFAFTEFKTADTYISNNIGENDLEKLIFNNSIMGVFFPRMINSYESYRQELLTTFNNLSDLHETSTPKFVIAHILLPHPPFVFDQNGEAVEPNRVFSLRDGSDYEGTKEEYLKGYGSQLLYTNTLVKETITKILANSNRQPIIIIQGDHGPGAYLDWASKDNTCLWERTGILNAYLVPDEIRDDLYPAISPVNSFRLILSHYFNSNLRPLKDKSFFSSHINEASLIDITTEIDLKVNCPSNP
jgi:hypothetical protein